MISADNKDMDGMQTTDGAVRASTGRALPSAARLIGDPQLTVNARSLQYNSQLTRCWSTSSQMIRTAKEHLSGTETTDRAVRVDQAARNCPPRRVRTSTQPLVHVFAVSCTALLNSR